MSVPEPGTTIADKLTTIAENEKRVYDAGLKSGKQAAYDAFWDAYQSNGSRTYYKGAFCGHGWTSKTFKPKYNMVIKDAQVMFQECGSIGDLVEILKNQGVTMDFSAVQYLEYTFYGAGISHLPEINATSSKNTQYAFSSSYIETIDKLILKDDGSQALGSATFYNATGLKNITIEGCIGKSISFTPCKLLTYDSLMSIINALKDYSTDTSGTTRTLSLGTTNLAKLTDEEKAIATQKGWTLS